MAIIEEVVYGEGGYDPGKPDGNVIGRGTFEIPDEVVKADTLRDRADKAIAAMQAHIDRGTFTAAQRDNALLLLLRVNVAVARLITGRLDAT